MAESSTPKKINEVGKKAATLPIQLQGGASAISRGLSRADSYEGSVNEDPMVSKINLLRQTAIRQGKLA